VSLGIFQGNSKLLLGQISQKGEKGIEVDVKAGDVIVLPAGTAHSNITSSPDYQYIGVYPQVEAEFIQLDYLSS
jgi:uncharacterized protein YjlB